MSEDTFLISGVSYPARWAQVKVSPTPKPDELIVRFYLDGLALPATYYVHPDLVQASEDLTPGEEGDGLVRVALIAEDDTDDLISVPGEAANYSRRLRIPKKLLRDPQAA